MKKTILFLFVTLALSEVLLRVFFKPSPPPPLFDVATMPSVLAEPWFPEWEREHAKLTREFKAYELYALEPFDGKYVGVTSEGYRRTLNAIAETEKATHIGLFGGSTMWGGLARDSHTIASELSAALNGTGFPAWVTNYGQVGFVFSQEIHQALRISYSTKPPQVMIFMDGVCDILAGLANFVNGVTDPAGKPWEYDKYHYLFQMGKTGEVAWSDVAKKSMLVRRLLKVAEQRGWVEPDRKNRFVAPTEQDKSRLAEQVSDQYLRTLATASRAFRGTGARPIFVLQPAIFLKNPLSEEEKEAMDRNKAWQGIVADAYAKIRAGSQKLPSDVEFWDISEIFQGSSETLYADIMHYSEAGNRKIAQALSSRLRAQPDPLL
ncbi:MAG: hypothetical protein H6617_06075 [Bdellovibrionaceae bacterium]|nr:hypothetical protein [Bdellovibrionales bacterium]MCB9254231.1 hypothetical protein [Pseudobdellovibrionaceae bacterium]